MATISVNVSGLKSVQAALKRANPKANTQIPAKFFTRVAGEIQRNAKDKQIAGGGRGKGKALVALPRKLTSREGTLRRSIRVNRGPLPWAVEVGTDLGYGAVHEFGGRFSIPSANVASHTRNVAFGKKVKPFTVPAHTRKAHTAKYPKRAFMQPALDAITPRMGKILVDVWKKEARL